MAYSDTQFTIERTIMDATITPQQPAIVITAFPTAKEQVVSYAIGIGLTAATFAVGFGALYVAGVVGQKIEARKAKKAPKNPEN